MRTKENTQIIVVVDNFNRFVILRALPNRKAETITSWVMTNIIGLFGIPLAFKIDNGGEFRGIFSDVCE